MENGGESSQTQSVRVAVNIRPLITHELLVGCTECITVYPAEKQVHIGSHSFTFDHVFGSKGSPSSTIYDECVAPLVDALIHGYNGTVLAYGQTGSGKTYTMGTNYNGEEHGDAVIPKVMETIFSKVETMKESSEFFIRVSFIEIFKKDVFDLLYPKTTGPARVPIQIRERVSGGITLAGVTELEVRTKKEMASYLLQGSLCRATGSTKMNSQSSRSHAIFTISMEQRRISHSSAGDDVADDVLIAKLHLVDLAGSERAKRTGADGSRFQEGIHINKGLLALGNVISALGDDKKRKEGGHVPYRDSKLTRILQDSVGGNSKTIMIACVSPADTNAEETLNTLKYANRARNIQNKAIINRDPITTQMQRMRSQIEQLQSELLCFRGDSSAPTEEIKILKQKVSLLEASKMDLQEVLHECRISHEYLIQRIDAQVERDRLLMQNGSIQNGNPLDEVYVKSDKELEGELVRIRSSNHLRHEKSVDFLDSEDDGTHSRNLFMDSDIKIEETDDVVEDVEKELEHSSIQEELDRELKELDKRLEQKELSEADKPERAFCGRGRWNQVRTLAEAKNAMNFLFNLASSSRCQLRDREVDCREKDSEIRELKEKIVNLVRQLELKKAEFNRQETLLKLALERQTEENSSGSMASNSDGHVYDLRPKGSRNSTILDSGLHVLELPEDMDTYSEDAEWVHPTVRKKHQSGKMNPKTCSCSRKSLCKTSRCECRAASSICCSSCSCGPSTCSNREEATVNVMLQLSAVGRSNRESSHDLASHGAMLLQTALSEKHANQNTDGTVRKPLSGIGNNNGLSNIPKPTDVGHHNRRRLDYFVSKST